MKSNDAVTVRFEGRRFRFEPTEDGLFELMKPSLDQYQWLVAKLISRVLETEEPDANSQQRYVLRKLLTAKLLSWEERDDGAALFTEEQVDSLQEMVWWASGSPLPKEEDRQKCIERVAELVAAELPEVVFCRESFPEYEALRFQKDGQIFPFRDDPCYFTVVKIYANGRLTVGSTTYPDCFTQSFAERVVEIGQMRVARPFELYADGCSESGCYVATKADVALSQDPEQMVEEAAALAVRSCKFMECVILPTILLQMALTPPCSAFEIGEGPEYALGDVCRRSLGDTEKGSVKGLAVGAAVDGRLDVIERFNPELAYNLGKQIVDWAKNAATIVDYSYDIPF